MVNVPSQSSADSSILWRLLGTRGESREVAGLGWMLLRDREKVRETLQCGINLALGGVDAHVWVGMEAQVHRGVYPRP